MTVLAILVSAALGAVALESLTSSPWISVALVSIIVIAGCLMLPQPSRLRRHAAGPDAIPDLPPLPEAGPAGEVSAALAEPPAEAIAPDVDLAAAPIAADPPPQPEAEPEPEPPFAMAPPVVVSDRDGPDMRCKMDLAATREGLELTIELPGLDETDVDIQVVGEMLTISGELRFSPDFKDKTYRVVERDYGAFSRSIALPEGVRADKIRADLSRGLLTVTIPNPVRPEPRRIEVQAGTMRLTETGEGQELTVSLPGLEQDDVEVAVCEGMLSVSGPRNPAAGRPAFSRAVELPAGVDAGRIRAAMSRGVLTVSIPRPTRPDPKRIDVLAA
jgi:HSP20 family protein